MKLYYSPGACSLCVHILLEEIGKPFELVRTPVAEGAAKTPEYLALNPKAKVPLLIRDSGRPLTEVPAISYYLAGLNPQAKLLPADAELAADAMEMVEYIASYVHMQGFTRWARPGNFVFAEADHERVKARGIEIFLEGLNLLDGKIAGREFAVGDHFTVADAALVFVSRWADRAGVARPANIDAHLARMKQRPSVKRAYATEGLDF